MAKNHFALFTVYVGERGSVGRNVRIPSYRGEGSEIAQKTGNSDITFHSTNFVC